MYENGYPIFFKDVETITMYDPLAKALGSAENGLIKYNYKQIVKFAGHSCPTVAGAYLLVLKALKVLYPDTTPIRGEIKVAFKDSIEDGVTGVISNVISNITGASGKGGFKGLNGNFARHSLLEFGTNIKAAVKFTRVDTQQSVELMYDPSVVPPSSKLQELMKKILSNSADAKEVEEFGKLWQNRVKRILIDNFDNDEIIK